MPDNEDDVLSRIEVSTETGPGRTAEPVEEIATAPLVGLPAAVGYWDADLRNRVANRAYVEFLGLTPEEIHGRHVSEVLGPELYALNRPHIERALAGEPQLFDRTIIDPAGEPRHTQVSYIPDVVEGKVRGFVVLVTDVTAPTSRRTGTRRR